MSDKDFDLKLKHIEEQYAARREGADAYRDQEMARLFGECGWTQEKIATRMGKKKSWVSYRLVFGRFLNFSTMVEKAPNLTERRFREYWQRTKGSEAERFNQVAYILENGIPTGLEAIRNQPGIDAAVLRCLEDGRWYTSRQILATVEESLIGVHEKQIYNSLQRLREKPPKGKRIESKRLAKVSQYRLRKAPRSSTPIDPVKLLDLYEQAKPLIEELHHWGRSSKFNIPPAELENIARKLEQLFDAVLAKDLA